MSLLAEISAKPSAVDVVFIISDLRRFCFKTGKVGPEQEIMVNADEVNDRLILIAAASKRCFGPETSLPTHFLALMRRCTDNANNSQLIGMQAVDGGLKSLEQQLIHESVLESA